MSIINQMLRDLDARTHSGNEAPSPSALEPDSPRPRRRAFAAAALLGTGVIAAAVAAYGLLPAASDPAGPMAGKVATSPPAHRVPVAVTPPALQERVRTLPPPGPAPALEEMPPSKPIVEAAMPQTAAPAARPPQARPAPDQDASATAQASPPVIKRMAELTPEAEALQLYDEAQALRDAGRNELAQARYRQALERNPAMVNARLKLARLLQEAGEPAEALALLKTGHARHADAALAIAVGRMQADLGRRDEALEWLARGEPALRPADQALMGALLSQSGRHAEAVRAYQQALAAESGQGGWWLGLGLSLEALGRAGEARAAYGKALERGPFKQEVTRFLRERSGVPGT